MSDENSFPLLPLRDVVVFPHMMVPLFVGREKSITALNEVMKTNKKIVLVTQKNSEVDDPGKNDIFIYGCKCSILQLLKLPDGTVKLLVEGIKRVKIIDFNDSGGFIICKVSYCEDVLNKKEDLYPLAITALRRLEKLSSVNRKIPTEILNNLKLLNGYMRMIARINVKQYIHASSAQSLLCLNIKRLYVYDRTYNR